ncbi:MAG: PrsW family glutamic-type intramembrane protease [Chitinophagaceae bacterium]
MLLLALALAPGLAIVFYIIAKDKYNKEPFKNLLYSFLLGVLSTLPAIVLQMLFKGRLETYFEGSSVIYYAFFAFGAVGLSEEFSKYLMLRYYAYRQKAFDEPLDGIIYGVIVSMGFATLENISYVMTFGYGTAIARMFLSVPTHACFGVIMGYYIGLAKFDKRRSYSLMQTGLLLAVLFHGAYDFFLFLQQNESVTKIFSTGLLSFCSILTLYIAVRLSFRAIRLHEELSRIAYENSRQLL